MKTDTGTWPGLSSLEALGYDPHDLRCIEGVQWRDGNCTSKKGTFTHYFLTSGGVILSCWKHGISGKWIWRRLTIRDGYVFMKEEGGRPARRVPYAAVIRWTERGVSHQRRSLTNALHT